jgi:zinc/manganese transport system substrate-binding protein
MPRVKSTRWASAVTACLLGATAMTGCAIGHSSHPGAVTVLASTDVWGSVAAAVTRSHQAVKSILSGANVDPHSYQPSPSDAAAITDAKLVVYNGGGYDSWVDGVLASHPAINTVDAYSFLRGTNDPNPPNEHVFYDLNVAKSVATAVANRMSEIDPANARDYQANAAEFCRGADSIALSEHAIASAYPATGVIATEPVVYYLLEAAGLVNRTPPAFSAANENETDPSPSDMATVLDLIERHQVAALLVNPQTLTDAITGVERAARQAGVPVTEVTETLPTGSDYLTWQRNTVNQLTAALRSSQLPS